MPTDEELIDMIADAYRRDELRLPLQAVTARRVQPARRALALVTVGATVLIVVALVVLALRPGVGRNGPPPPPAATSSTNAKPPQPTTTASDDAQRCIDIAAQTPEVGTLPPLRSSASSGQLRLLLFGDDTRLIGCWLNADRVDFGGSPEAVSTDGSYTMQAYGISLTDPAYFQLPAEYAFGRAPVGTTTVEIRFATGAPVTTQANGGFWGYFGIGVLRLDQATEIVFTTPGGPQVITVQHG